MPFLNYFSIIGLRYSSNNSEARNVALINWISIILFSAVVGLLIVRFLLFGVLPDIYLLSIGPIFLFPILLNRFGFLPIAKLYLCWIPSIAILFIIILQLKELDTIKTSFYDAIFIFLLGISCIPFLVLDTGNRVQFWFGISVQTIIISFCDPILDLFDVGHGIKGIAGDEFEKSEMRAKIAYFIIACSCYTLKWLVEKEEKQNEILVNELAQKNKLLKEKSVQELNDALNKLEAKNKELEKNQIKLQFNEQRLSLALSATSDAIWEWDYVSGKFFFSQKWYEILGYQESEFEMNSNNFQKLCHPDDYKLVAENISQVIFNPQSKGYSVEFRILHRNKFWVWILSRGNVVKRDQNNNPLLLSGTNTDISDRKRAEVALFSTEQKYKQIFENIQEIYFQTDLSGFILEISPSIEIFTGVDRKSLIGKSIYDLFYNFSGKELFINELIKHEKLYKYELKLKSKDGEVINAFLNIRLIYSVDGKPIYLEGIIIDNSESKKNEKTQEELFEASQRLALATKSARIGIWEWHIDTNDLIWDEQMHLLFGTTSDYKIPKDWNNWIIEEDMPLLSKKIRQAIKNQIELRVDFKIILPTNEEKHIETIAILVEAPGKPKKMIGICWDITQRKIAEEKLMQSEANLSATINNTTFFIWSIDKNFRIINLNKPFKTFIKEQYNVEVIENQSIEDFYSYEINEFSANWTHLYARALIGESFEMSLQRGERHFKYSLNPIVENANIAGVTVFAEEMTELRAKESALFEADRQIGELKLMALRSAMNPHFIFNTLSSIQYFILKNEKLNAVNYLSTFSKLIRSILNNSVTNKIRLTDEIEQIKNYVDLELLRFDNKFNFILDIEDELDVDNIEIASMLIQPYIENAILHGLYSKKENGILHISIKEEGNYILFQIEDNGIGRVAASQYKYESSTGHKSLGTVLTEERLKLINVQNYASHEIEDLYEQGKPSGTRVKIWVNYF